MLDSDQRRDFVAKEITYTDGTAGRRTAAFILQVVNSLDGH